MSGNETPNTPHPTWDRLPPPAFPPGRRRWRVPAPPPDAVPSATREEALQSSLPDGTVRRTERPEVGTFDLETGKADEKPMLRVDVNPIPEDFEAVVGRILPQALESDWTAGSDPDEGADEYVDPWEDPHLTLLVEALRRLVDELAAHGEEALGVNREMTPFETTLRAYCLGYLEGLRELAS